MRDRALDLGKGLAILFVYLGHSILYNPIRMAEMYSWCEVLNHFITSFNMPMFFIISGYLFSKTRKSTLDLYKGKTLRILVPYIFTMAIIVCAKLFMPSSMSYNDAAGGGLKSMIMNMLCYGGDRWFVYVLYIIFLILIPIRGLLKKRWFDLSLIAILIGVWALDFLPELFTLDKVFYFMVFFILGFMLDEKYSAIKTWTLKYWWVTYVVFIFTNLIFIIPLFQIQFVFRFLLPITGTLAVMTMAFQLERSIERSKVVQYIEYCGKYSLQFYLFTFCYPMIRTVIVSVLHITNPIIILLSVFILQLVSSTIIVEITRRIKWLKIPCGY